MSCFSTAQSRRRNRCCIVCTDTITLN